MKNQKAVCVSNSIKHCDSIWTTYSDLKIGKTYKILDLQHGMISIIDESDESYFYPISMFDVDFGA